MDPILQNHVHFSGEEGTSEEQERVKRKFPFLGRVFYKEKMEQRAASGGEEEELPPPPPKTEKEKEKEMDQLKMEDDDDDDDDAEFFAIMNDEKKAEPESPKKSIKPELKTHNEHDDPQTCYVQHVIATTVFGKNLPKDPPKWGVDPEDLYLDKTFYHKAVLGSEKFRIENYEPLVERVAEKFQKLVSPSPLMMEIHRMVADCPEMICNLVQDNPSHKSAWTNRSLTKDHYEIILSKDKNKANTRTIYMEPEHAIRLCGIHVIYHLWRYINASYVQNYKTEQIANLNFMDLWTYLVSDEFHDLPISGWCEPFFDVFADKIFKIFETYNAIDEWSREE